jgi:hypothetical protein
MGRKSSITIIDPRLKTAIDAAITEGRATIDDIVQMVRGMGGDVSRSAVGRYKKSMEERLAEFRESQAIAGDWMKQLRAEPDGDIGRMLGELLKVIAHRTQMDMLDTGADAKEIALLARAIGDLARTDKLKLELEAKARAAALDEAASQAERSATEAGLSAERAAQIRRDVLGLRPAPAPAAS